MEKRSNSLTALKTSVFLEVAIDPDLQETGARRFARAYRTTTSSTRSDLGAHFDQGPAAHNLDVLYVPLEADPPSTRDTASSS